VGDLNQRVVVGKGLKMKMFSKSLMILSVAGMLFAASPRECRGEDCNRREYDKVTKYEQMKKGRVNHRKMFDSIELSKEQIEKINEIHKESRESHKDTQKKLMTSKKALVVELDIENSSPAKIAELKKDILSVQEQKLDNMIKMKLEMKEILTDEQANKLKELHDEKRDKREENKAKKTLFQRMLRR